jgi:hypothetical protein
MYIMTVHLQLWIWMVTLQRPFFKHKRLGKGLEMMEGECA